MTCTNAFASFAYHAANREEKLPRKPLPPAGGRGGGTTTAALSR